MPPAIKNGISSFSDKRGKNIHFKMLFIQIHLDSCAFMSNHFREKNKIFCFVSNSALVSLTHTQFYHLRPFNCTILRPNMLFDIYLKQLRTKGLPSSFDIESKQSWLKYLLTRRRRWIERKKMLMWQNSQWLAQHLNSFNWWIDIGYYYERGFIRSDITLST